MVPNINQDRGGGRTHTKRTQINNKTFNCQSIATTLNHLVFLFPKLKPLVPYPSKRWPGLEMLHLTTWQTEPETSVFISKDRDS